jgi:DNA-binding MarR family transcriptional regulator
VEIHGATAVAATLTTDELLELLYRRDIALAHHRSTVARTLRVTETELLALIHLVRRGDTAPSGLAERLDLSSGGATALVQRLVAGGHVTRHPHPGDRRSTLLRVTPATARALGDADASLLAGLDALVDSLSDEQRTTVAAFLAALAEGVEQLAAVQRDDAGSGADALERPVPSVWA